MSGNEDAQNLSPESKAFKFGLDVINQSEPLIADFIRAELENQRSQLKLIAWRITLLLLFSLQWEIGLATNMLKELQGIDSTLDVSLLIKSETLAANMRRIYLGLAMLMSNPIQELMQFSSLLGAPLAPH